MTFKEARIEFTGLLVKLIQYMRLRNYKPAFGEGMDRKTKKDPTSDHMNGSLHDIGLAQDIDLYSVDGEWLDDTEDHKEFGDFWESLHPFCKWGGRFRDGNHYSFAPPELVGNKK